MLGIIKKLLKKKKKTLLFYVHVYQEDVIWQFFRFSKHSREDLFFLQ